MDKKAMYKLSYGLFILTARVPSLNYLNILVFNPGGI